MKISYVTEYFEPKYGGQYKPLKNILNILKKKKIKVSILHKNSKTYHDKQKLILFIKKSDIIHIFGGWTWFYIKIHRICIKLKKKIILHPMGFFEPWSMNQKKIKKKLAWHLYQKKFLLSSNLVHCASFLEEESIKKLNNNIKTVVIPLGIEKKFILRNIKKPLKKKVLFFSRMHVKKGIFMLIQAWSEINTHGWELDIYGAGNQNLFDKKIGNLKNKKINFKKKPIFTDAQKKKLFSKYDILILPSMNENFGLVILEALARGLPVLTTNETPWIEVEKKNAGWIINYSLVELKIVLNKIFSIKNKELEIKQKNSIMIAKNYLTEILFKIYLNTYRKLFQAN